MLDKLHATSWVWVDGDKLCCGQWVYCGVRKEGAGDLSGGGGDAGWSFDQSCHVS